MTNKMWGGRFGDDPDAIMADINTSIDVDRKLFRQDIAASRAHAEMLAAQGIISAVSARYTALGVQIPATQPLATALDYRDKPGTLASKFGSAAQHVTALADAVLNVVSKPIGVAAE